MSALEKLGSSLTNAVRKLLNSSIVDEATVKELIKEFQRALLQADVNVQLVLNLSKEIEQKALDEKLPPGISRREHVVTVVYDQLAKFLGEQPRTVRVEPGKPNVFMLVGIQGSGKCVTGDSHIELPSGKSKPIANLFQEHITSCDKIVIVDDGIAIQPRNFIVQSYNVESGYIETKQVDWIWKLNAPPKLIEVQIEGAKVTKLVTTPEHPFFSHQFQSISTIRADELSLGQQILIAPEKPQILQTLQILIGKNQHSSLSHQDEVMGLETQSASSPPCWGEVTQIQHKAHHSNQYVYDLTVSGYHNFIANNIVVHNTTSAAKLARYFQKRGFKTALVCADAFRLGAFNQLQQLAERIKVPFYGDPAETRALEIATIGVEKFRNGNFEVILLDTAGRHKDEKDLIAEMKQVAHKVKPDEVILVIDATIGQQASTQAIAFNESTEIGSILLTKMDSSARGGGALSAVAVTGVPIKFIGVGEDVEELEPFNPPRFVGRLIGMGDIEGLVKKVREAENVVPEKKVKAMLKGKFTLMDMYDQMEAMSGIGPLKRVINMIPGMSYRVPDDALEVAEDKIKKWKYIIQSMTIKERENPKLLNNSRIRRVARGSGTSEKEVKEVVKQYFTTRKLMRSMGKRKMPPFLRKMLGQMK
jgi:signal recognition particle subunit SRP54